MFTLYIWSLEHHLTIVKNNIVFILSIKILWRLAREDGSKIKLFCFFVNYIVESPIVSTWTISEFDRIILISLEKFPKFSRDSGWLDWIWIDQWIKKKFSNMYWIYDDNNVIYLSGLVDITSDSKEFSFSGSDINCMIESLDN